MKTILVIIMSFVIVACDTKLKESNQNNASIPESENPDWISLFSAFKQKFKPIDLPYIYRMTDLEMDKIQGLKKVNPNSFDSLFIQSEFANQVYCLGYLTDTSKFYSLIFLFPADSYYPVLATFSKEGKPISQDAILANGCGADCGVDSWSMNALISKDYSIICSDTLRWKYFCDSIGEPIPNSAETWVYSIAGEVKNSGKIQISDTKQTKTKNNP